MLRGAFPVAAPPFFLSAEFGFVFACKSGVRPMTMIMPLLEKINPPAPGLQRPSNGVLCGVQGGQASRMRLAGMCSDSDAPAVQSPQLASLSWEELA